MNLLGYTSTSLLREEQALNAKLRDALTKERAKYTALKKQFDILSENFDEQRADYLKCIKEKANLVQQVKKTNERYDAFVTVTGTNFATHFDRVLKKRKVLD